MMKTYLSGFTTVLGERRAMLDLPQLQKAPELAAYLEKCGFRHYRKSSVPPAQLAAQCLHALQAKAPDALAKVDCIVYASVTLADSRFYNEQLGETLCAFGLDQVNLTGLFTAQCGNLGNALMLARTLILAGKATNVLVLLSDICMDENARVYDGNLIVSDGASCMIVNGQQGDFELVDTFQAANHKLSQQMTSAENLPRYLKQSSDGIRTCLDRLLSAGCVQNGQVRKFVTNHYAKSVLAMFAYLADVDMELTHTDNIAEVGHAYSCDVCLSLEDLARDPSLQAGDQLICLSTGKSTWFSSLLVKT